MCIMQVIRRTNRYIINFYPFPSQFFTMAVKPFKLCKKMSIGKISIENSCRIMFIQRSQQVITGFLDRLHVFRRYVAGSSYKNEILHLLFICIEHGDKDYVPLNPP